MALHQEEQDPEREALLERVRLIQQIRRQQQERSAILSGAGEEQQPAQPAQEPGAASRFFGGVKEFAVDPLAQIAGDLGILSKAAITGDVRSPEAAEARARFASIPPGIIQAIAERAGIGGRQLGEAFALSGPSTELTERTRRMAAENPEIPAPPEPGISIGERAGLAGKGALNIGLAGAGAVPGAGGVASRLGASVIGPAVGGAVDIAAEGDVARGAGQVAGLLAPFAAGRAATSLAGRLKPRAPLELQTPAGRSITIPQTRGQTTPGVAGAGFRAIEGITRASEFARKPLTKFDVARTRVLIDDAAAGIASDISTFQGSTGAAARRLTTRLKEAQARILKEAKAGLDDADAAVAQLDIVPAKTREFAREQAVLIRKSPAKLADDPALLAELDSLANMQAGNAAPFITLMRRLREKAPTDPTPGVKGGLAKKVLVEMAADIDNSIKLQSPAAARQFRQANRTFRAVQTRLENVTFQRILKAAPEKVPDILRTVDVADIRKLRKAVGEEAFGATSAALFKRGLTRAIEGEILSGGPFQGATVGERVLSTFSPVRKLRERPLRTFFETLAEDGRAVAIYGPEVMRSVKQLVDIVENASKSQQVGLGSLIGRGLDAAILFSGLRFTFPAAEISIVAGLNLISRLATRPKTSSITARFFRAFTESNGPAIAFWGARLGKLIGEDPELVAILKETDEQQDATVDIELRR